MMRCVGKIFFKPVLLGIASAHGFETPGQLNMLERATQYHKCNAFYCGIAYESLMMELAFSIGTDNAGNAQKTLFAKRSDQQYESTVECALALHLLVQMHRAVRAGDIALINECRCEFQPYWYVGDHPIYTSLIMQWKLMSKLMTPAGVAFRNSWAVMRCKGQADKWEAIDQNREEGNADCNRLAPRVGIPSDANYTVNMAAAPFTLRRKQPRWAQRDWLVGGAVTVPVPVPKTTNIRQISWLHALSYAGREQQSRAMIGLIPHTT